MHRHSYRNQANKQRKLYDENVSLNQVKENASVSEPRQDEHCSTCGPVIIVSSGSVNRLFKTDQNVWKLFDICSQGMAQVKV